MVAYSRVCCVSHSENHFILIQICFHYVVVIMAACCAECPGLLQHVCPLMPSFVIISPSNGRRTIAPSFLFLPTVLQRKAPGFLSFSAASATDPVHSSQQLMLGCPCLEGCAAPAALGWAESHPTLEALSGQQNDGDQTTKSSFWIFSPFPCILFSPPLSLSDSSLLKGVS